MPVAPQEMSASGDPEALRQVFACFPSGVVAICGLYAGTPAGMAASAFTGVSLEPPLVSVCLQNSSTTWSKLRLLPWLGISVLNEDHGDLCRRLSAKAGDRFAGVEWTASAEGAVFLADAATWLDCAVEREMPAGDHILALLRVRRFHSDATAAPLVFHGRRFRKLEPDGRASG